jgi:predicted Na+-dependent transporter
MHIEPRLLVFTKGVRWRIAAAVAIGLLSVGLGVARLGLLGWLIGQVFAGRNASELALPIVLVAVVMVLRGTAEHWRMRRRRACKRCCGASSTTRSRP